jgi:hypothetical protein
MLCSLGERGADKFDKSGKSDKIGEIDKYGKFGQNRIRQKRIK